MILCLILAGMIWFGRDQNLKVIFLDVGQGDAILIMQGSNQILIDGGPSGQILMEKLGRYVPFWDREIEMVIATHPDQDHIEGLLGAMKKYQVGSLIETTVQNESQLYEKFEELISEKQIQKIISQPGMKIKFDQAEIEIMGPRGEVPTGEVKDTNAYSIVARLVFGQNSFLFTGDLPEDKEREIIGGKIELQADVLKVSHHGSKYSTSGEFLEAVEPRDAIISVGKNNRYGHPAPEIIERLQNKKINIFRTDESGDIKYVCMSPEFECALVAK